jgi:hypothetical protein
MSERFTKISDQGLALPIWEPEWSAVIDASTGLMWSVEVKQITEFKYAAGAAESMNAAGLYGWRLPSVQELWSLCDTSLWHPAIDTSFFPYTRLGWYVSATRYMGSPPSLAWAVNFANAQVGPHSKMTFAFVRGVRLP